MALTLKQVQTAMQQLEEAGKSTSIRNIRELTGTGGHEIIMRHKQAIESQNPDKDFDPAKDIQMLLKQALRASEMLGFVQVQGLPEGVIGKVQGFLPDWKPEDGQTELVEGLLNALEVMDSNLLLSISRLAQAKKGA